VLLFDVDGTLVTTGGAGRRAIERAFETLHGRRDATHSFGFDGMTDRAIVRQGLTAIGQAVSEARIDELLAAYLALLEEEVARAEAARYRVHSGMREAVAAGLAAGMAVGLGTGNVERGARVKLARVGLSEQFAFGGFGDDHEVRAELIRSGATRGAARLGVALAEARVVVIGDTPRDVDAAQAIGAESMAVGTGHWTAEQLAAHGATFAFADLTHPAALDALLHGR
jgi:phosphoglycolate phosphatase